MRLAGLAAAMTLAGVLYFQIEVIRRGGPVMIAIILCSIFSMAIIIERGLDIYHCLAESKKYFSDVMAALDHNRLADARELAQQATVPAAAVVKAGLAGTGLSREQLRQAIEDAGAHAVPPLERHLNTLATIAHVSPLLGLLGTVTGMVQTFQAIQQRAQIAAPVDPALLAQGIWEALITTVAGLLVAIPSFVAYNYFVSKVQCIITDMEFFATQLVNRLGRIAGS